MSYNREMYQLIQEKFMKCFNQHWTSLMDELYFKQEQFTAGNRLRPYIVLIGYLSSKTNFNLKIDEIENLSKLSVCIELIHKSSLILDDLIDGDPARHGKKAFHIEYGADNTIMFAINLLSIAVSRMNLLLTQTDEYIILKQKGINLLTKTMYDMSLGELKELTLDEENRYNYKKIQEIINLETSPLIANSLLFGYYAGNGCNRTIENTLETIGYECGYIFQVMNDLEPFCQQKKLEQHKGRLNTDIIQAKKNIALSLLYNLISEKEKQKLSLASRENEINELLIQYFNQYKIKNSFMREVELTHKNIKEQVMLLSTLGISREWCEIVDFFVEYILNECTARLR